MKLLPLKDDIKKMYDQIELNVDIGPVKNLLYNHVYNLLGFRLDTLKEDKNDFVRMNIGDFNKQHIDDKGNIIFHNIVKPLTDFAVYSNFSITGKLKNCDLNISINTKPNEYISVGNRQFSIDIDTASLISYNPRKGYKFIDHWRIPIGIELKDGNGNLKRLQFNFSKYNHTEPVYGKNINEIVGNYNDHFYAVHIKNSYDKAGWAIPGAVTYYYDSSFNLVYYKYNTDKLVKKLLNENVIRLNMLGDIIYDEDYILYCMKYGG